MPDKLKVYVLPGILGSEMSTHEPILPNKLWVEPIRIALGDVMNLKLAPGGILPDPYYGRTCVKGAPLSDYYGAAIDRLANDLDSETWEVIPWGYDWRRDISGQAHVLAAYIIGQSTALRPATIVAHSQGGLLARLVWYELMEKGQTGKLRRIVTVGTPHEGCYSPCIVFAGVDEAIDQIRRAESITAGLAAGITKINLTPLPHDAEEIARMAATWPSMYQLMPLVTPESPDYDPDRAELFNPANWPPSQEISAKWLAYAAAAWRTILNDPKSRPPASTLIAVAGIGNSTAYALDSVSGIGNTDGFFETSEGDGRVPARSAIPFWATGELVYGKHGELMMIEAVLSKLKQWVEHEELRPLIYYGAASQQLPSSGAALKPEVAGPPFTIDPPLWFDP